MTQGGPPTKKMKTNEELEKYFPVIYKGNKIMCLAKEPDFDQVQCIRLKDTTIDLEYRFIQLGIDYYCDIRGGRFFRDNSERRYIFV